MQGTSDVRDITTCFLQLKLSMHSSSLPVKSRDMTHGADNGKMSAIPRVSRAIWSTIQLQLPSSLGSLLTSTLHDVILAYSPRSFHLILHLHFTCIARQQELSVVYECF